MDSRIFFENFELLAEAPGGLGKLRELILELAVRGKLVPQEAGDEPASVLLERIAAEKARLVKEGKLKKQEPLPPVREEEMPFELPEGWASARLGNVASIRGGKRLPNGASYAPSPTPHMYIQVTNMKNGTIVDNGLKYITDDVQKEISETVPRKADLVPLQP